MTLAADNAMKECARNWQQARRRQKLLEAFAKWRLGDLQLENLLWRGEMKAMRRFPAGLYFQQDVKGSWSLPAQATHSLPLQRLKSDTDFAQFRIVASGPSLRDYSGWEEERCTIAVNGAGAWMVEEGRSADFLVVSDRRFAREKGELIERGLQGGACLLATPQVLATMVAQGQRLPEKHSVFEIVNEWYAAPALSREELGALGLRVPEKGQLSRVGWSDELALGVFSGATVAYPALQIAVWLGGRDIEFAGLDLGGSARAYEEKEAQPSQLDQHFEAFIRPAFELAKTVLAPRGIQVRNPSPVCPIDLNFPSSSADEPPSQ